MRFAAAAAVPRVSSSSLGRWLAWTVPFATVGAAAVLIVTRVEAPSVGLALGLAAGIGLTVWMFFSERMERPLVVLLLYLGLLEGFLKLRTDSTVITSVRDVLLYAILLGFLVRAALRRQSLPLPPLSGWVLAVTVVVLVQIANPSSHGILHTLGALRPHLEFVPLFFVGYFMLQTRARLRTFSRRNSSPSLAPIERGFTPSIPAVRAPRLLRTRSQPTVRTAGSQTRLNRSSNRRSGPSVAHRCSLVWISSTRERASSRLGHGASMFTGALVVAAVRSLGSETEDVHGAREIGWRHLCQDTAVLSDLIHQLRRCERARVYGRIAPNPVSLGRAPTRLVVSPG